MSRAITRVIIPLAIGLALGLLLMRFLAGDPEPQVRYRTVVVPESVIVAQEPDTVVRFVERIRYREVEPEQVATAPKAALPDVAAFCSAAGWVEASAGVDSVPPGQPVGPPVPPMLLLRSFAYDDGALTLWGPRSDGELWRGDYQVGRKFRGTVQGDGVFIQADRLDRWKQLGERALWVGAGAAIGYAVGQF